MNPAAWVNALLSAYPLPECITGVPSFSLADLELPAQRPDLELPTNLRLGHLAEHIAGQLISAASSYRLLKHSIQVGDAHHTLGELDFLLQRGLDEQAIHLEFAYKFYLLEPDSNRALVDQWIGPNRNDTLSRKLATLHNRQFPLLHHPRTAEALGDLQPADFTQQLCLLSALYLPQHYALASLPEAWRPGVRGRYTSFRAFRQDANSGHLFHIPPKTQWGLSPTHCHTWCAYEEVLPQLQAAANEQRAILCWEKTDSQLREFFLVPW